MTPDDFTEAAIRHFDESYDIARLPMPGTLAVEMAEWARRYYAQQEPTEDEVESAAVAICSGEGGCDPCFNWDESVDGGCTYCTRHARAALSAARAARRNEEKR